MESADLSSVDVIIHLAGKAHDTKNTSDAQAYFDINVGLTKKIFDYFLSSGAEKFIYFSSVKAVTDAVREKVLTEEAECNPMTPYGKSKLEAEEYIEERRHDGTTARLHDGTNARRNDGKTARTHDGTTARRHDDTTARETIHYSLFNIHYSLFIFHYLCNS